MNDLKNGIIDINGFLLSPTTTVEEMENHFGVKATDSGLRKHIDFDGKPFVSDGIEFKGDISFKDKVTAIKLFPQLPSLITKYNIKGCWEYPTSGDPDVDLLYFREVRNSMDSWLEKQLGAPTQKDEKTTTYVFPLVSISTCAYFQKEPHGFSVLGGKVKIEFEYLPSTLLD